MLLYIMNELTFYIFWREVGGDVCIVMGNCCLRRMYQFSLTQEEDAVVTTATNSLKVCFPPDEMMSLSDHTADSVSLALIFSLLLYPSLIYCCLCSSVWYV